VSQVHALENVLRAKRFRKLLPETGPFPALIPRYDGLARTPLQDAYPGVVPVPGRLPKRHPFDREIPVLGHGDEFTALHSSHLQAKVWRSSPMSMERITVDRRAQRGRQDYRGQRALLCCELDSE
jgi:hypothetical protein